MAIFLPLSVNYHMRIHNEHCLTYIHLQLTFEFDNLILCAHKLVLPHWDCTLGKTALPYLTKSLLQCARNNMCQVTVLVL